MGWSSDFVNALDASSITPIYELEIVQTPINGSEKIYSDHGALQIVEARVEGTSVISASMVRVFWFLLGFSCGRHHKIYKIFAAWMYRDSSVPT